MFGVPYLISGISSPILGFAIDKLGRRALFISLSSAVLIFAFVLSMTSEPCDQCKSELVPLVLVGIAYSIYAAAIWGSIPYVVTP